MICAGGEDVLVSIVGVNGRGVLRTPSYVMPPWVSLGAAGLRASTRFDGQTEPSRRCYQCRPLLSVDNYQ